MTNTPSTAPSPGSASGENYARYVRVRAALRGTTNYISDNAAPAMLCLLRRAEPRPYTPVPTSLIKYHVQPLDFEARPSYFVAHQVIMDFYRTLNGHYGIDTPPSDLADLLAMSSGVCHTAGEQANAAPPGPTAGSGPTKPRSKRGRDEETAPFARHAATAGGAGGKGSTGVVTSPASSAGGDATDDFTKQAEAYRLVQFRRQAQHVDNSTFNKRPCFEFSARGSCARGARCHFLHVSKNSAGSAPGSGPSHVVLPPKPQ